MNHDKIGSLFTQILSSRTQLVDLDSQALSQGNEKLASIPVDGTFSTILGDPENEVIHFSWSDGIYTFGTSVTEQGIDKANVIDGDIELVDAEGDSLKIRLFQLIRVKAVVDWK